MLTKTPGVSLTVGVLGGLGPAATLDYFQRVLAYTPARTDQEHLHLIIDNNPKVPNRNEAIAGTGPSPVPALLGMAERLQAAGADFLVMICNSAHAFETEISASLRIPLVSIVEETADALLEQQPGIKAAGVLAADAALGARLYQDALERRGVKALVLDGEGRRKFMALLYRIKSGDLDVRAEMAALAGELASAGAEAIVAGCTEVPLVLKPADVTLPLLDSTDILARRTVRYALGELPLPAVGKDRKPAQFSLRSKAPR